MATIRLVPSTYYLSNSTYLTVSSAANMYTNTDSTTYGTVTNTRTSTTSYYIYLRGFNFNDIPSGVIINSFSVKIKAYQSGGSTNTSYIPYLCNDTTTLTGCTSSAITTSTQTLTFSTGTYTLDDFIGYGSNFGIRVNCRRNSRNTQSVFYIYGAEIEVNYTIPVYHTVTATGDGTLSPVGAQSVLEGEDYTLYISGLTAKPTVTDNNVDVTNSVTQTSEVTNILIPESYSSTSFTVSDISNAYADADSGDYADLTLAAGGTTGTLYLDMQDLDIPSGATITGVSCQATLQYNRNGSSSGFTASCQMYTGSTAKGSATSVVSAGDTDMAKTTFNLTVGSWTTSEITNARFYLTATNNASGTQRHLYVYGVSFSVTYESDGVIYVYSIDNVQGDHTIIVTATGPSQVMYVKVNGSWVAASKVYKKIGGTWVEQSDLTAVFDSGTNYRKG